MYRVLGIVGTSCLFYVSNDKPSSRTLEHIPPSSCCWHPLSSGIRDHPYQRSRMEILNQSTPMDWFSFLWRRHVPKVCTNLGEYTVMETHDSKLVIASKINPVDHVSCHSTDVEFRNDGPTCILSFVKLTEQYCDILYLVSCLYVSSHSTKPSYKWLII